MASPITTIPFGQPLLFNDVLGGIPLNDWHYPEQIHDCREEEYSLPFFASGDYISLQFIGLNTNSPVSGDYALVLVGDTISYSSVTIFPWLIKDIDSTHNQYAWYFQAPSNFSGDQCFHLDVYKGTTKILTTQTFKIYQTAPGCSINITWQNEDDAFGFIYKKTPYSNPVLPDFNNTAGWTSDAGWDLASIPGKALLDFASVTMQAVETNGTVSGLVLNNNYKLTVSFNWNENASFKFFIGTLLVGQIFNAGTNYYNTGSFIVSFDFVYNGTGQKFRMEATPGTTPFSTHTERTSVELAALTSNNPEVKQSIRLTTIIWKPNYPKDKTTFKDSLGIRHILAASSEPVYELAIEQVPENIHNALRLAEDNDTYEIDGIKYDVISDEYAPEWKEFTTLAVARRDLVKSGGASIRGNC